MSRVTVRESVAELHVVDNASGSVVASFDLESSDPRPRINQVCHTTKAIGVLRTHDSGARTDHPHQYGMWFGYGSVNGMDFWAPQEARGGTGSTRLLSWTAVPNDVVRVEQASTWLDPHEGQELAKVVSSYQLAADASTTSIQIEYRLVASRTLELGDTKEGLVAARVRDELAEPVEQETGYASGDGVIEVVPASNGRAAGRMFVEGVTGDAWGTIGPRAGFVGEILDGAVEVHLEPLSAATGRPGYWHIRHYGLLAHNPLAVAAFAPGAAALTMLAPGDELCFRYRLGIR